MLGKLNTTYETGTWWELHRISNWAWDSRVMMRWKGANEVTVSMQIVELRLGTRVYFVMWHWWGQHVHWWIDFQQLPPSSYTSSNLAHDLLLITPYFPVSHPLDKAYELFQEQESAVSAGQQSVAVLAAPFPLPLLLRAWCQPCPVPHPSRMKQQTQPHIHAPPQPDNFLHSYKKTYKYLSRQWGLMYGCMFLDI